MRLSRQHSDSINININKFLNSHCSVNGGSMAVVVLASCRWLILSVLSIDSSSKQMPLKCRICQTAESQKQLLSFRKVIYVYLCAWTHTNDVFCLKHHSGCHFSCWKIGNMLRVAEHYKSGLQLCVQQTLLFINCKLHWDYYRLVISNNLNLECNQFIHTIWKLTLILVMYNK